MPSIQLTQGHSALVDEEDFDYLGAWKWHYKASGRTGYARRNTYEGHGHLTRKMVVVYMHVVIAARAGLPEAPTVDHENRNGLDNRRHNLRPAKRDEQVRNRGRQSNNSSGYIGASFHRGAGRWRAQIHVTGKTLYLGLYDTVELASAAHRAAAIQHFGSFASSALS